MRERLEGEIVQLKMVNIKLDSENRVIKMRNEMLEETVRQSQEAQTASSSPIDTPAYQILKQENQQLKALLKMQLTSQ